MSSKSSDLLENLIVKYGQIVTTQQIFSEARIFLNHKKTRYLITILTKQGWLVRIKNGLYTISDLSSRGFLSLSSHTVAYLLVKDSYVSFESALHYHNMFDQLVSKIISISLKTHRTVQLQNIQYSFIKTKVDYCFGWQEVNRDNKIVHIATAEKALIDMIHFHRNIYAIDLVIEKLCEYENDLDLVQLNTYISKMSMTTIKIFGILFDLLKIDSSQLLKLTKRTSGAHRMTRGAKMFNAKWRLYYDVYFDKYKK